MEKLEWCVKNFDDMFSRFDRYQRMTLDENTFRKYYKNIIKIRKYFRPRYDGQIRQLEPRRRAATPGPGESVSDMGACGVVGGAESARAM